MDSETFNSLLSSLTLILCKHILQEMKKVAERESVERSCKRINFLYSQISDDGYKFYQCMLCDFKTEVGKEIKIHFLTHSNEEKFKCHLCDYSTSRKNELESHKRFHTRHNLLECDQCNRKYFDSKNLVAHLKRRHTNV